MVDFLVSRADLRQCRFDTSPDFKLEPGQVLLGIDKFALTANNITYAVFGDAMSYWNFFPGPTGWGRVPVWGFAQVLKSRHDEVPEGERVYGYVPMSTHLVVQPDRVADGTFMDASAHRRALPSPYQRYQNVSKLPGGHDPATEDFHPLLVPLYATSFLIDDFLADNDLFGARSVILSSASSKTSFGLAFLLKRSRRGEVIGLTSKGNVAFCEQLGCYDRVVSYDQIASLPTQPTVFVDMAGEGKVLHDLHHHFRDQLKYSCIVGASHWEKRATQHALPGPKPVFFFAPNQVKKRTQDWGPGGVDRHFAEVWQPFVDFVRPWMRVILGRGETAVRDTYLRMLEGRTPPAEAHVLSLQ